MKSYKKAHNLLQKISFRMYDKIFVENLNSF